MSRVVSQCTPYGYGFVLTKTWNELVCFIQRSPFAGWQGAKNVCWWTAGGMDKKQSPITRRQSIRQTIKKPSRKLTLSSVVIYGVWMCQRSTCIGTLLSSCAFCFRSGVVCVEVHLPREWDWQKICHFFCVSKQLWTQYTGMLENFQSGWRIFSFSQFWHWIRSLTCTQQMSDNTMLVDTFGSWLSFVPISKAYPVRQERHAVVYEFSFATVWISLAAWRYFWGQINKYCVLIRRDFVRTN